MNEGILTLIFVCVVEISESSVSLIDFMVSLEFQVGPVDKIKFLRFPVSLLPGFQHVNEVLFYPDSTAP